MKKRIFTLSALALCLLFGLALFRLGTVSAQALETAQWAYEEENGEIRLMRYLGSEQTVTVPAQLDGKPVTALGDGAMAGIPTTVSITVESGVATVGEEAFSDCPNLASVTLPDSVTSIGRRAFRYCMALKSVTLPKTLAELPYQGFWDCQSLESIVIPDSVTTIPNGFLYNGFALQEVTVPGSVTAIEKNAFHACTHLNYISLSENVTQFDDMAFSDCDFLVILAPEGSAAALFAQEYGYVPETVVYETPHPYTEDVSYTHTEPGSPAALKVTFSRHTYVFGSLGMDKIVLKDANGTEFVYVGDELAGQTVVLAGDTFTVKLESYFADANLSDFGIRITDVLPMSAEDYAAYLQDLDENPWLSHIVNGTVEITGYRGLKSEATVPAKLNGISVTSIANRAFAENRILTHVTVENGVLRIGAESFMNCMALAQIDLPDSVTEIGESAFFYCPELTELRVPAGVTAIPDTFACSCEKLAAVTLPQNLESIGENAFSSCTALTEIEIPATVTKIGSEAFGATGLTSVSLPHGITTVASSLFGACEALTEVSLPETVTEIERFAFSGCAVLTEIQLPAGLKAIRNSAFAATGLETIALPEGLETVEKYAFHNSCLTAIAIPSTVREIGINPFSFCHSMTEITVAADNPQYKAEENCLLSKDGTTLLACLSGFDGVFTVPDGVTAIGQEACSGALMTGAVIPETVTELGLGAFTDSKNLKSVDMHAQVTAIPESCFMNCTALEKIHLPQTLTSVDRMAFYSCNNLKTVHYAGTQAEWDGIDKARGTPEFTVHFLRKTSTLPSGTHSGCRDGLYCSECDEILCGGTEIPSAISAVSVSESGKITIAPQTGETARIILAAYRDGWLAYAYTAELRGGVYEIQTKELSENLTWKVFFVDETCVPVHSAHLLPLS